MRTFWQDLRYAARAMAKKPLFTAVVVLTLAVGIGANTTVFSAVNALLLRPLPYRDADRIAMLYQKNERTGEDRLPQAYANYVDFKDRARSFDKLAAYYGVSLNLTGAGEPERLIGTMATASLFDVLGVQPHLGSAFTTEHEEPGKDKVVLISYGLWQRRFGSDPNIIGQSISLSETRREIVGVMPAGFKFPHKDAELWVPLAVDARQRTARTGSRWLLIGRLREGVTLEQARGESIAIAASLRQQHPDALAGFAVSVVSLHEQVVGEVKPALLILMGAVGFVLLIACVNVANLLLARAAAREREIAIRLAVGAGRWRIVRQLLTESLMLAGIGGVLGLLLGYAGLKVLLVLNPAGIPRLDQVDMDLRVLAFTLGVSLLTGIVFGVAPALQASKPDLIEALKEGGRNSLVSARGRRLRSALLVAEVALSLLLLVGAGLMVKSFIRLQQVELGFNPDRVVAMNLQLPRAMWLDPPRSEAFFKQLIERIELLPGVESCGAISAIFIGAQPGGSKFIVEGSPALSLAEQSEAPVDMVSNGYFRTMGIRVLEGREFADEDAASAPPVVIINKTFARRFWHGASPLGKRIKFGAADSRAPWLTVVGVVEDMRRRGLEADAGCEAFLPHAQSPMGFMTVVTRVSQTAGEPLQMVPALHGAVWSLSKEQPISHTMTVDKMLEEETAARRLNTLLFIVFAGLALVLASAGVYGVMSYSVAQRTHEIGVRLALGAGRGDVLRQFVREGMRLTVSGLVIGLVCAYFATRLMASLLFEVGETDVAIFIIIPFLLALVALLSCAIPARRATRIDPLVALRHE